MKKKDLVLAQKVIAAKRVKQELEELKSPGSTKKFSSSRPFTSSGKSLSSSSLPAPYHSPVQSNNNTVSYFNT